LTAVIGTRNASREGICANEYFTRELVSYNIGITSGLAIGHDSIAHRTALSNGGFTVAVLGSGIDIIYPEEHKRLYDEICKKGAIISEYPPGTPPLKTHFPIRNRIISGLSEAVLLIQAPEKSGALITAKCAEIQNRELLVCPGNPADPRNRGSNNLIRIGAKIAIEPFDVIREILGNNPKKINEMLSINENNLTDEEKFLLDKLSGETLIDDLIGISGMSLAKINHLLNTMEMRGLVTQYPGRIYSRKIP
jgi:DNA processing protein